MTIESSDLLRSDEHDLVGKWLDVGGRIEGDAVTERIRVLAAEQLVRLASSADGWDTLYRDPADGRLWELTYPHSEWHGGGPPRLRELDAAEAARKYPDHEQPE
jgi:immunity protein 27 of polymorphic toxin system